MVVISFYLGVIVVISWTAGVCHYGAKEIQGWLWPLTAVETAKLETIWLLGHVISGFCQLILGFVYESAEIQCASILILLKYSIAYAH